MVNICVKFRMMIIYKNQPAAIYKLQSASRPGGTRKKVWYYFPRNLIFLIAAFALVKVVSQNLVNPIVPALFFLSIITIAINMKRLIKNYPYKKN